MRFQIGQTLFAVQFETSHPHRENSTQLFSMPLRFNNEMPKKITIIKMEVAEHHRVPGEWDDEIKYDGFILTDIENSTKYTNQYPRAAYGQISDEGDRRFHLQLDKKKDPKSFDEALSGKTVYELHLLTDVLERIETGIKELTSVGCVQADIEKSILLQKVKEDTIKQFSESFPDYDLAYSVKGLWEDSTIMRPHYEIDKRVTAI